MGALAALWGWRYVADLNARNKCCVPIPTQIDTGAENAYIYRADDPYR